MTSKNLTSKLEVLVELGSSPESTIDRTLSELKSQEGVTAAVFKDGAIMVETTLPSAHILDVVTKASGKRAVLQGFGETQSAVAMVSSQSCCCRSALGVVRLQQSAEGPLIADGSVDGLPPGPLALEVHECGDLSQGCKSIGGIYDCSYEGTGDQTRRKLAGDLGTIEADENGRSTFRIVDDVLKVWDVIGRSIAITKKSVVLGKEDATPLVCGIIARSSGIFQNPKRICACDGVVVWDEKDKPLAGKGRRHGGNCCSKETHESKATGVDERPTCSL